MTKAIEIVVIGGTGTGKSHVLELIDKALRAEYGHHVQIASHDLSLERGLGSPSEKPRVSDTIFSLREQGLDSGKTVGSLKIEIDTSEVVAALEKVEALGKAYWRSQIESGSVEELQGFTTGYAIDPLEEAIESTVRMLRDEHQQMADAGAKQDSALCDRLGIHLDALLAIQIERMSNHEHH